MHACGFSDFLYRSSVSLMTLVLSVSKTPTMQVQSKAVIVITIQLFALAAGKVYLFVHMQVD